MEVKCFMKKINLRKVTIANLKCYNVKMFAIVIHCQLTYGGNNSCTDWKSCCGDCVN